MRLKKLALIAEIVGALAIVISLVFVGFQLRRTSNATYAASFDALVSEHIDWRMTIATDPELQDALTASIASAGGQNVIDPSDLAWEAYSQIYEKAYFMRMRGTLGDTEWERFASGMCFVRTIRDSWGLSSFIVSQDFLDYLDTLTCDQ